MGSKISIKRNKINQGANQGAKPCERFALFFFVITVNNRLFQTPNSYKRNVFFLMSETGKNRCIDPQNFWGCPLDCIGVLPYTK
jgi:hypothetical protein